jgi:ribosomal protein S18 acetylase RimI-like enzyme
VIHAAFAVQSAATNPPSGALAETVASIADALQTGGAGIERDGRLVAVVLWQEKDGGLYFGRLAVAPSHRGQGLARRLVDAAAAEARRRLLPRIHASVRLALADNRAFFARLGFTEGERSAHPGFAEPTSVAISRPV